MNDLVPVGEAPTGAAEAAALPISKDRFMKSGYYECILAAKSQGTVIDSSVMQLELDTIKACAHTNTTHDSPKTASACALSVPNT